jgi:hypothetical protein
MTVTIDALLSGDAVLTSPEVGAARAATTVTEAAQFGRPVNAIALPLTPPRGGLVDFARTDAGMLIIHDLSVTRAWALQVVAVITKLDLVDVTPDDLGAIL